MVGRSQRTPCARATATAAAAALSDAAVVFTATILPEREFADPLDAAFGRLPLLVPLMARVVDSASIVGAASSLGTTVERSKSGGSAWPAPRAEPPWTGALLGPALALG